MIRPPFGIRPIVCLPLLLLLPLPAAAQEPVSAVTLDAGASVDPGLLGINEDWPAGSWPLAPSSGSLLRSLGFATTRFPGGTVSLFWDALDGRVVADDLCRAVGPATFHDRYVELGRIQAGEPAGARGIPALASLAAGGPVEVQWVANLMTVPIERDIAAVDAFRAAGGDLRHVELGNELYFTFHAKRFPDGEAYLRAAAPLIDHVRSAVPAVRLGAVASADGVLYAAKTDGDERPSAGERWNAGLLRARDRYDAWIVHTYHIKPASFAHLPAAAWRTLFLAQPWAMLANGADVSRRTGIPLWITEYGIGYHFLRRSLKGDEVGEPSAFARFYAGTRSGPLHALAVAAHLMAGLEFHRAYELMGYHSLSSMEGFACARPVPGDPTRARINCVAQLLSHLQHLARNADRVAALAFPGGPALPLAIAGRADVPVLQGVAFRRAGSTTLAILNRGADALDLDWPADATSLRTTTYLGDWPPDDLPFPGPSSETWNQDAYGWRTMTMAELDAPHPWPGPMAAGIGAPAPGHPIPLPPISLTLVETSVPGRDRP